jgi:hypothetical protein
MHGCYQNLAQGSVSYALRDLTGGAAQVCDSVHVCVSKHACARMGCIGSCLWADLLRLAVSSCRDHHPSCHLASTGVAHACTQCGTYMHTVWHIHAHSVAHACTQCGTCMHTVWHMHAHSVAHTCTQCGTCMHTVWYMHAHSVAHACTQCGTCMHTG